MWILFTLLGVLCWAVLNVIDSILARNYEGQPRVISWHQSSFSVPILLVLFLLLHPAWTPWMPYFLAVGALANMGDLVLWHSLGRIDVSVTNFIWAFLAVIMSVAGFTLFRERWAMTQAAGA